MIISIAHSATAVRAVSTLAIACGIALPSTRITAQSAIPVRQLCPAEAVSRTTVGSIGGIRELSNGQVLVNDAGNRRVIVFDSTLSEFRTVADSSVATHNLYGKRATLIIPYVADTTLLVDVGARAFLVMSPAGAVTRVMSPPRPTDLAMMGSAEMGRPGFDRDGRLI